ncbi:hypothetical protein OEA41_001796 [Lepraria neglecta]|uniref:Uncharacterized protein n=1 Tax=Lepraria neglecta TaxID=209136 RepID=A0AAD9ZAD7_9LECA|nr:hypothetical protein OEA41_001796 [Lepraria neglecta]
MLRKAFTNGGRFAPSFYASAKPHKVPITRYSSTQTSNSDKSTPETKNENKDRLKSGADEASKKKRKTQAELDEELRQKLEGIAGDGGEAGMELENGQPVSMKRGVKENMFRYI